MKQQPLISKWYSHNFEHRLQGRYVCAKHLLPILESYKKVFEISELGTSEKGEIIHCIKIGTGKKVVLAWSQMHGNESTTTKALFDFLAFLTQKEVLQKEIQDFLAHHTLHCIPMLNPDGALLYTRENANNIDLNRDAKHRTQKESRILRDLFERVHPELCLNLHDQRTMYSLPDGQPATLAFLAPAANARRTVTLSRRAAMQDIVRVNKVLQQLIPGKVGRYDDSFNDNCVGDSFQKAGVSTILFEAGHFPNDYQRERTRAYVFHAFLALFEFQKVSEETLDYKSYFNIPENEKQFIDVIIRNVCIAGHTELVSLGIQYTEELEDGAIVFVPYIEEIDDLSNLLGHKEIDAQGEAVLLNSHENVFVNAKVSTIMSKNSKTLLFSKEI